MLETRVSNYGYWLLNIAAFVTLIGVATQAVYRLDNGRSQQIALLYFALFGILLALYLQTENRPWWVHLYLLLQTILVYLLYSIDPPDMLNTQALLFVLSAQSMIFLSMRAGLIWVLVFAAFSTLAGGHVMGMERWPDLVSGVGGFIFFASFGAALRQADDGRHRNRHLFEQLQESHEQLKNYTLQAEQLAVSEERNRVAREMHDALGHRLTVAIVQLEGAQRLIPKQPERAAEMVGTMREQLKEALAELRQTLATLRSPLADDLPLPTAVSQLTHTFQEATSITIHLNMPNNLPPMLAPHRLALYRAVQEGLTNIQRHAQATEAWLSLQPNGKTVKLTLADNGIGFDSATPNGRFGLQGLAERAKQLNGRFHWQNRPAGGAEITFQLPIEETT